MINVRRSLRLAGMAVVVTAAVIGSTAVVAAPAFADAATATTLTVTANKTTMTSGKPVSFTAVVVPAKVGTTKITGVVDWTVVGQDGSIVPCTTITALTGGGKSRCQIEKGNLLGAASLYTATATYLGDAAFATSTGSTTLEVTEGITRLKIDISAVPTSGAATTFTATVVDGPATPLVAGKVVFTVNSQYHAPGTPLNSGGAIRCTGAALPAASNNTKTLVAQVASCSVPAGWMTVPNATKANPKPQDGWSVVATYNGNSSFSSSSSSKHGNAKF